MNTFVLSDDTKNTYNFKVLTDGIETDDFEKNPVMLWMHRRGEVIGRWENVRKQDGKLLADAVIDESTEEHRAIKEQVERGFLNACSIGFETLEDGYDKDGEKVVSRCKLIEASLVDIPANLHAIKSDLVKGKHFKIISLAGEFKVDFKTALIDLLGLDNDASEEDILSAVESLVNGPKDGVEDMVDDALSFGCFDLSQKDFFVRLAQKDKTSFANLVATQKAKDCNTTKTVTQQAIRKGLICAKDEPMFLIIGSRLGSSFLSRLFGTFREPIRPTDVIGLSDNKAFWTLEQYRKFAPNELKENPKLYAELLEKSKKGVQIPPERTLDWYRKNEPETLKENPELYKELLTKNR